MWLVVESGPGAGCAARIAGARFTVGSGPECDLRIDRPDVAPLHATIAIRSDGGFEIRDEGATEGVFVEGERVSGAVALNGDEKLRLGDDVLLSLSLDAPPEGPTVEVPARRWRAVVRSLRETRRAVRRAVAAAAAALVAAATLAVLLLTGVVGGGDDDPGAGRSVAEVVERAGPSTVLVRARVGDVEATGSGFTIDAPRGLVVTNFHVINGGRRFDVRVGGDFRRAQVVGAAPCDDLALLRVERAAGMTELELGSQEDLRQGQAVVALGFPANPSLRGELTSTAGVVSVPRSSFRLPTPDSPRFENLIQTDAALNVGNSGGPLVDGDGRLVGVNTAIYAAGRGPSSAQGYAIGVDRVKEVLAELRKGRSLLWPGAGLTPAPDGIAKRAGREGLLVTTAVPGTAAAAAGLEGILLTSLNGRPLDGTIAGYCSAAEGTASGDTVQAEAVVEPDGTPQPLALEMD